MTTAKLKENRIIKLLRDRGIVFDVFSEPEQEILKSSFIERFVSDRKRESLALNLRRPPIRQRPVDYYRYFEPSRTTDGWDTEKHGPSLLGWLSNKKNLSSCDLVWSEPLIPAFRIQLASMTDSDLFLFVDSYWISLSSGRVVVITRDGDVLLSEAERRNGR